MMTFRFRTIVTIISLLAVHAAGFVAMLLLLQSVEDSVTDLNSSGVDWLGGWIVLQCGGMEFDPLRPIVPCGHPDSNRLPYMAAAFACRKVMENAIDVRNIGVTMSDVSTLSQLGNFNGNLQSVVDDLLFVSSMFKVCTIILA